MVPLPKNLVVEICSSDTRIFPQSDDRRSSLAGVELCKHVAEVLEYFLGSAERLNPNNPCLYAQTRMIPASGLGHDHGHELARVV